MMKMNPLICKLSELVPLYLDDIILGHWTVAGGLQKQALDPNKHIGKCHCVERRTETGKSSIHWGQWSLWEAVGGCVDQLGEEKGVEPTIVLSYCV